MKQLICYLYILSFLISCSNNSERKKIETVEEMDFVQPEVLLIDNDPVEYAEFDNTSNEIPPNGKYRFDIAFAEWQGKSMGEKVTVVISGRSIKVVYEGDGSLSFTEKGEIIDEGQILKHKSGDWIIGHSPEAGNLDEVGGCTGGPAIIDFKNKKYWMC